VTELEPAIGPHDQPGHQQVPDQFVQERRVDHRNRDVALRDTVEHVHAAHAGLRVQTGVEFEPPREISGAAEEFLIEVVVDSADGLGRHDAGSDRVGHGGQRYALPATSDPRADPTQRDRAPDAEPAVIDLEDVQRILTRAEVELIVGDDVVQAPADQSEQHGNHGDVGDRALRAATCGPTAFSPPDRHGNADDDAQRVRTDRQGPEVPDSPIGTGYVGEESSSRVHSVHRYYGSCCSTAPRRTPVASSAAVARTASAPCRPAETRADPTMTPSANAATSAAWLPERTPNPTPIGQSVCFLVRSTSPRACSPTVSRSPVTPITAVA